MVGLQEAEAFWKEWVEGRGYEGVVARTPRGGFKVKPELTVDAAVVGVKKTERLRVGSVVTSLRLALMSPEGDLVHVGDVSSGIDPETGRRLHALVKHFAVGEDREAYHVRPVLVAEVRCFDVYPGLRQVWRWDGRRYAARQPRSFFSLKSPVLVRFREDKQLRPEDLALEQIPEAGPFSFGEGEP
ncbi:hypothetical protein [Candidatus Hecatella orcuttiae]|uniref:ATP dependent DNA ligase n=1 Tax=Candidatus Hecatella orcuttiae TaxID=1935119 RepID=UPI00286827CB|nr:hypothetical protein [Candidatus Hecatella orcuttiae]